MVNIVTLAGDITMNIFEMLPDIRQADTAFIRFLVRRPPLYLYTCIFLRQLMPSPLYCIIAIIIDDRLINTPLHKAAMAGWAISQSLWWDRATTPAGHATIAYRYISQLILLPIFSTIAFAD